MKVIIPIHDDFTHITEFQSVLAEHKSDVLFVFDRCKPPEGFDWNYKIHEDPRDCFLAGKARSFGASFFDDDICFFDQDKVPTKDPFVIFNKKGEYDCILIFTQNDDRNNLFKNESGSIGEVVKYTDAVRNYVYTSGIWISKEAKREVTLLNSGTLFNSVFDGVWGEEDQFLGDELIALGYKIGYTRKIHTLETPVGKLGGERVVPLLNQYAKRLQLKMAISLRFVNKHYIDWGVPIFDKSFLQIAALSLKAKADNVIVENAYEKTVDGKDDFITRCLVCDVESLKGNDAGINFKYSEKQEDA